MSEETAREYRLMHPLENVPATATQTSDWYDNGRLAGLVLVFPGGHTASLTFKEIRASQEKAMVWQLAEADLLVRALFTWKEK